MLVKCRWLLPEGMIRHEGNAEPAGLRMVRVRGVSMEPELREGATASSSTPPPRPPRPASSSCSGTWGGLVVKGVVPSPGDGTFRLVSATRQQQRQYSNNNANRRVILPILGLCRMMADSVLCP